jgi:hypothetical protein
MSLDEQARPKTKYPFAVLADCAQREVKWRRTHYPNKIMTGRMSHAFAQQEIDKMQAIAEILVELAKGEKLL